MKSYESDDVLTNHLRRMGIAVEPHCLPGTRIILGGIFHYGSAKIAYRFEQETSTVILSYYQREGERKGLKNSFAEVLWFFDLLAKPELNIALVKGLVMPSRKETDGLEASRLEQFYRMIGATFIEKDNEGAEWIGSTPEKYRQWRAQNS